jgi:hypothetical protein
MPLLDPMGITGPTSPAPYQQPNIAAPTVSSAVASYPVGFNSLNVATPLTPYVQPGTSAPSLLPGQLVGGSLGISGSSIGGSKP